MDYNDSGTNKIYNFSAFSCLNNSFELTEFF